MTNPTEIWRPVPGWGGAYEASSLGQVRSIDRVISRRDGTRVFQPGKMLKPFLNGRYWKVNLCHQGRYTPTPVNRIVLLAFVGPPSVTAYQACHDDGDEANNTLSNLYWGTPKQNADDMKRHGRHRNGRKTHCQNGHEFTPENTIWNAHGRRCRECKNAYDRDHWRQYRYGADHS